MRLLNCLVIGVVLVSGCSTINNQVESYSHYKRLSDSKFIILEAQVALAEGRMKEAKALLDDAFNTYKDQAALHKAYHDYYSKMNDERLAALALYRHDNMISRSKALSKKGRIAMEKYEYFDIANNLFSLSLAYWADNTDTLINIATLGFVTQNPSMGLAAIKQLASLGFSSPESTLLTYL